MTSIIMTKVIGSVSRLAICFVLCLFCVASPISDTPTDHRFLVVDKRLATKARSGMPPPPAPLEFRPMTEAQAMLANEHLPFSKAPLEVPDSLNIIGMTENLQARREALDCMTSAIYYEAGFESDSGKRAVAQVILNRVRHPSFPNSVCGVIYQGSERPTGCQFTFTCDGSLARVPKMASWAKAQAIARSALSGRVEEQIGMATHYHTTKVFPYWAPTLDKVATVGSHVFYKWIGSWGKKISFNQFPLLDSIRANTLSHANVELGEDLSFADELTKENFLKADDVIPLEEVLDKLKELPPPSLIVADKVAGALIVDDTVTELRTGSTLSERNSPP